MRSQPCSKEWLTVKDISTEDPILIGGSGRSGTTLMSVILNAHPQLFCGPEFPFLIEAEFSLSAISAHLNYDEQQLRKMVHATENRIQFIEQLIRDIKKHKVINRFVSKTPVYIFYLDSILATFPNAQFIYMCRDGRDVAVSMRKNAKNIALRYDATYNEELLSIKYCAETWRTFVNAYRPWAYDSRCHLVRYEDLVVDPELTLQRICGFLNLPYTEVMQDFYTKGLSERSDLNQPHLVGVTKPLYKGRISQWQKELSNEQVKIFEKYAGKELEYLGYKLINQESHTCKN